MEMLLYYFFGFIILCILFFLLLWRFVKSFKATNREFTFVLEIIGVATMARAFLPLGYRTDPHKYLAKETVIG